MNELLVKNLWIVHCQMLVLAEAKVRERERGREEEGEEDGGGGAALLAQLPLL